MKMRGHLIMTRGGVKALGFFEIQYWIPLNPKDDVTNFKLAGCSFVELDLMDVYTGFKYVPSRQPTTLVEHLSVWWNERKERKRQELIKSRWVA